MSHPWIAQRPIGPDSALKMVADQFPELSPQKISLLGSGWDNSAFLINDHYVFRFPRRAVAVSILETEYRVLPQIASLLPIAIPLPLWRGLPAADFPWPFVGYEMMPGSTACGLNLNNADRDKLTEPLASFLLALHRIPISSDLSACLPGDLLDRLKIERIAPIIEKNLRELADLKLLEGAEQLVSLARAIAKELQNSPGDKQTLLVHGDLYSRHLLLNGAHELTGIIDWGDLHQGDTAIDLALIHSFLPVSSHTRFRTLYGQINESRWQLARLRALYSATLLMQYGYHSNDAAILREGRWTLSQISDSKPA